jgi:Domain of unknown function (DUF4148)
MRGFTLFAVSIAAVATAGTSVLASAQEKTRAQVRQELIEAQSNGLRFVQVAPALVAQAAQLKTANDSGIGAAATGASSAGKSTSASPDTDGSSCAGPIDFCTPYFGG